MAEEIVTVERLIQRHRRWWTREPVDRPLVQVSVGTYEYVLHGLRVSLGDGCLRHEELRPAEFLDSYRWTSPIASDGHIFVVQIYQTTQAATPPCHGGYGSAFGVWAPGTTLPTQEDTSALISPAHTPPFPKAAQRSPTGARVRRIPVTSPRQDSAERLRPRA